MSLAARAKFNNYAPWTFGWSARDPRGDAALLVPFHHSLVSFGSMHRDVVGLFTGLLNDLVPLIPGGLVAGTCGCYNPRSVTVGGDRSFHTYGIAIDVNWHANPMGVQRHPTGPHTLPSGASAIAQRYGCEWGGDWTDPKDWMHIECHLRPEVARTVVPGAVAAPVPSEVSAAALRLTDHQFCNAQGVVAAVRRRGWPSKAAVIAVATALTESGMRILASANVPASVRYPHDLLSWTDDGLGHDHASCGMYQQQVGPTYARPGTSTVADSTWGPPWVLMDPERSTEKFLDALDRTDWRNRPNWVSAQAVQHSSFSDGSNYRKHNDRAQEIVAALWAPTDPTEVEMKIVQDAATGRRYVLVPGRPVMAVTKDGARAYAALFGLTTDFPKVSHGALKMYDLRMRRNYSGVQ